MIHFTIQMLFINDHSITNENGIHIHKGMRQSQRISDDIDIVMCKNKSRLTIQESLNLVLILINHLRDSSGYLTSV